jgi:hypothetical protein
MTYDVRLPASRGMLARVRAVAQYREPLTYDVERGEWVLTFASDIEARAAQAAARNGGNMIDLLDSRQYQRFRSAPEPLPCDCPAWQRALVGHGVRHWWGRVVCEYALCEVAAIWTPEPHCYPWDMEAV